MATMYAAEVEAVRSLKSGKVCTRILDCTQDWHLAEVIDDVEYQLAETFPNKTCTVSISGRKLYVHVKPRSRRKGA